MSVIQAPPVAVVARLELNAGIHQLLGAEIVNQLQSLGTETTLESQPLQALSKAIDEQLATAFWGESCHFDQIDIQTLVRARAWAMEQLLLFIWQHTANKSQLSLIATGGFGRGELHPYSDIDLLILLPENASDQSRENIETFVQTLWDAGFYPGHSVRTVKQCIADAKADVQFVTNLIEARLLAGNPSQFEQLHAGISPLSIWPADTFFAAKMAEQSERHEKYFDTAFNLEPNIKESPGGLRDLQMIKWVTQRHFNTLTLYGLLEYHFLELQEFERLLACRDFIWRVRYALHLLAGRAEDRLIFQYQHTLAEKFGFLDLPDNLAVEQFMQAYYRNALRVERMNERLLQLFREELILDKEQDKVVIIDAQFQSRQGYLEIRESDLFTRRPSALLELFLALQKHPEVKGIRATTIRAIRNHLYLIDDAFRANPLNYKIFLQLLAQQQGIYTQFKRMNRYGVLESFIPAYAKITGRMQYDLFHVYTVDQHTLFVIRNLRRFAYGHYRQRFPHGQAVYQRVPRPQILYLAAFFHDIAKGRGGDHSTLGASDAEQFCRTANISKKNRLLVVWLVQNHLLMSMTAQRRDISDASVITEFRQKIPDREHLDALYLLTMADIAATSPKLWNGWKDSLLWQLYRATVHRIKHEHPAPDRDEIVQALRKNLNKKLAGTPVDSKAQAALWNSIPEDKLQRLSIDQLSWASRHILTAAPADTCVAIRPVTSGDNTEVLIYTRDFKGLFAAVIQIFDQMCLNILSARVITTSLGYAFDLFQISNTRNEPLSSRDAERLQTYLEKLLQERQWQALKKQKLPSKFRYFDDQPELFFEQLPKQQLTRLNLACLDQPGLLSHLSALFTEQNLILEDARIATFGHRVEDAFLLRNNDNEVLSESQQNHLKQAITQLLAEWE